MFSAVKAAHIVQDRDSYGAVNVVHIGKIGYFKLDGLKPPMIKLFCKGHTIQLSWLPLSS